MQLFAIDFDNVNRVFFPGQTVSGKVNLQLSKEMKIKGMYLTLFGGARTDWNEGDTGLRGESRSRTSSRTNGIILEHRTRANSLRYHRHYKSEQIFVNEQILLTGHGENGENTVLSAGQHSFTFSFQLPVTCLPSFDGWHGNIRYFCKAHIDRPAPHFDNHCKEMFTVVGRYDLNKIPDVAEEQCVEDEQKLSSGLLFGSSSGCISSKMQISKKAYVPGEVIELKITIKNLSNRIVKSEKVQMTQNVFYCGTQDGLPYEKRQIINEIRIIWEKKQPIVIDPNSESTITEKIAVPAVAPTSNNCEIIKIHYSIQCKAEESGLYHSFTTSPMPVIIGTVPMKSSDKLPAVFENSVFGKTNVREQDDNEHTHGNLIFAPKYAVYYDHALSL